MMDWDMDWEEFLSKPNRRRVQEEGTHKVVSQGNWVPEKLKRDNRKDQDRHRNQKLRNAGKK